MYSISELRATLKDNFDLHKPRLECILKIIVGLISLRTINLSQLATVFGQQATMSSHYRRLQRFFSEVELSDEIVAKIVLKILPIKGKVRLAMDRTNWRFGKTPINILMVSIQYRNIAIPLVWDVLSKEGCSNYEERTNIIRRLKRKFPLLEIECLTLDREFIGKDWLQWLDAVGIHFIVRVKKNLKVESLSGNEVHLGKLFGKSRKGRCLNRRRKIFGLPLWISGKILDDKSELLLISNFHNKSALELYKERWKIETLFGDLKTRGFRLEDTHMTDPKKIKSILCLLTIAYCWSYKVGESISEYAPLKKKSHGRLEKSIFSYGLQSIRQSIFSILLNQIGESCTAKCWLGTQDRYTLGFTP